jgi:hypothetical protein
MFRTLKAKEKSSRKGGAFLFQFVFFAKTICE